MQKTSDDIIIFLTISTIVIIFMGVFVLTILVLYRKKQITYLKEIEQIKINHEKDILKTRLEIQEQTFQTISRDIHDNINLTLTLAKLNLTIIDLNNSNKSGTLIKHTVELVSKAIFDLTDISRAMNSDIVVEYGLISALEREVEKINRLDWFATKLEIDGSPVFMDTKTDLFIFRIIQEAFNNILKHAQAKNARLCLSFKQNQLYIEITDDGIGFNCLQSKEHKRITTGLINMKKRAELLNGRLEMQSTAGIGTKIGITIPINQ